LFHQLLTITILLDLSTVVSYDRKNLQNLS
jgi:hypothetical protein